MTSNQVKGTIEFKNFQSPTIEPFDYIYYNDQIKLTDQNYPNRTVEYIRKYQSSLLHKHYSSPNLYEGSDTYINNLYVFSFVNYENYVKFHRNKTNNTITIALSDISMYKYSLTDQYVIQVSDFTKETPDKSNKKIEEYTQIFIQGGDSNELINKNYYFRIANDSVNIQFVIASDKCKYDASVGEFSTYMTQCQFHNSEINISTINEFQLHSQEDISIISYYEKGTKKINEASGNLLTYHLHFPTSKSIDENFPPLLLEPNKKKENIYSFYHHIGLSTLEKAPESSADSKKFTFSLKDIGRIIIHHENTLYRNAKAFLHIYLFTPDNSIEYNDPIFDSSINNLNLTKENSFSPSSKNLAYYYASFFIPEQDTLTITTSVDNITLSSSFSLDVLSSNPSLISMKRKNCMNLKNNYCNNNLCFKNLECLVSLGSLISFENDKSATLQSFKISSKNSDCEIQNNSLLKCNSTFGNDVEVTMLEIGSGLSFDLKLSNVPEKIIPPSTNIAFNNCTIGSKTISCGINIAALFQNSTPFMFYVNESLIEDYYNIQEIEDNSNLQRTITLLIENKNDSTFQIGNDSISFKYKQQYILDLSTIQLIDIQVPDKPEIQMLSYTQPLEVPIYIYPLDSGTQCKLLQVNNTNSITGKLIDQINGMQYILKIEVTLPSLNDFTEFRIACLKSQTNSEIIGIKSFVVFAVSSLTMDLTSRIYSTKTDNVVITTNHLDFIEGIDYPYLVYRNDIQYRYETFISVKKESVFEYKCMFEYDFSICNLKCQMNNSDSKSFWSKSVEFNITCTNTSLKQALANNQAQCVDNCIFIKCDFIISWLTPYTYRFPLHSCFHNIPTIEFSTNRKVKGENITIHPYIKYSSFYNDFLYSSVFLKDCTYSNYMLKCSENLTSTFSLIDIYSRESNSLPFQYYIITNGLKEEGDSYTTGIKRKDISINNTLFKKCVITHYPTINNNINYDITYPIPVIINDTIKWTIDNNIQSNVQTMKLKCDDDIYPNYTYTFYFTVNTIEQNSLLNKYNIFYYKENKLSIQCETFFEKKIDFAQCDELTTPYTQNCSIVKRFSMDETNGNNTLIKHLVYYSNKYYFSYNSLNKADFIGYYRLFPNKAALFNSYSAYYSDSSFKLSIINNYFHSIPYYINTTYKGEKDNIVIQNETFLNPLLIAFNQKDILIENRKTKELYFFGSPTEFIIDTNFYNSFSIEQNKSVLSFSNSLPYKKLKYNNKECNNCKLAPSSLTNKSFLFQDKFSISIEDEPILNLQLQIHTGYTIIDNKGTLQILNSFNSFPVEKSDHKIEILFDYIDPSFIFENSTFSNIISNHQYYFGHINLSPFSDIDKNLYIIINNKVEIVNKTSFAITEKGRTYKDITLYQQYPIFHNFTNQSYPNHIPITFDYHDNQTTNSSISLISYLSSHYNPYYKVTLNDTPTTYNITINYIEKSKLIQLTLPEPIPQCNSFNINVFNYNSNDPSIIFSIKEFYHLHDYSYNHISISENFNFTSQQFSIYYDFYTLFEFDSGLFNINFKYNQINYSEQSLIPNIIRVNDKPSFQILFYQMNPFKNLTNNKNVYNTLSMNQEYLIYVNYTNQYYPEPTLPNFYKNQSLWPPLFSFENNFSIQFTTNPFISLPYNIIRFKLTKENFINLPISDNKFYANLSVTNILSYYGGTNQTSYNSNNYTINFSLVNTEVSLESTIDYSDYDTYSSFNPTRFISDYEHQNYMNYTLINPFSLKTIKEIKSSCENFVINTDWDGSSNSLSFYTDISEYQITSGKCSIDILDNNNNALTHYNYAFCQNLLCNNRQEYTNVKCDANKLTIKPYNSSLGRVMADSFKISNNTMFNAFIGKDLFIWEQNDNNYNGAQKFLYNLSCIPNNIYQNLEPQINQSFVWITETEKEITIFGNNFRPSCYCYYYTLDDFSYVISHYYSSTIIHCNITGFEKDQFNLDIRCIDHGSLLTTGSYEEIKLRSQNMPDLYISNTSLEVNIERVTIEMVSFKSKKENKYKDAKDDVKGHNHGGYEAKVKLTNQPKCLQNSNCTVDNFVFNINGNIFRPFSNENSTSFLFLMPPINENYTIANISFSFNGGNSFTKTFSFELSGLCNNNTYCEDYKKRSITKGHFCDIFPNKTFDKYCHLERPCLPGTYTNFDNNTYTCKKVARGFYLNYWGADYSFIQPKPCPRGFICTEEGLPKYYEICPPGRKCLNEKMYKYQRFFFYPTLLTDYFKNQQTDNNDVNCQENYYCKLGVLRGNKEGNLSEIFQILSTNEKLMFYNRMYWLQNAFQYNISTNYIKDLAVRKCERGSGCSSKHEFYDRVSKIIIKSYS